MHKIISRTLLVFPWLLACSAPAPGGDSETNGTPQLPCDVAAVLQQKCLLCHSKALALSAPMPIVTYADTQADRNGQPVWKLMQSAIDTGRMPAFGSLSDEQKATLNAWFAKQAPPGEACAEGALGSGADTSGIVQLGNTNIVVPASVEDHTITNTCNALSKNGKPVMIVSAIPHTHYLGRLVTTEHFRNGASIGFVSRIGGPDGYDWTKYESTPYGHEYLPGDSLVTTCHYDNPNAYGFGYPAEMCHNFLIVSPITEANQACASE